MTDQQTNVYRVTSLCFGRSIEPEARIYFLGDPERTVTLKYRFTLVRGSGRTILVDTGCDQADGEVFNPDMGQTEEMRPLNLLRKAGVEPSQVTDIIFTHLHWDHCSPLVKAFPGANLYVQRKELGAIVDPPHPWFAAHAFDELVRSFLHKNRDTLTIIDGDAEPLPGVKVLLLGGHTLGSQAVVVQTEEGPLALTGDVAITPRNLREDLPVGYNCDLLACFRGLKRIRQLGGAVITGHDPEFSA